MKVLGIIAEYDPFHNGHKYLMEELSRESSSDFIVCVMSGAFTQRGLPACFDKTVRAGMAISAGADLVLELPYIYACSSGNEFARGGIGILEGLGCVTDIGFGCESADKDLLQEVAAAVCKARGCASHVRNDNMTISYGEALTRALKEDIGEKTQELRKPNNLLAVEYLCALNECGSGMRVHPVKRVGVDHGATSIESSFASGSYIREILGKGEGAFFDKFVPDTTMAMIKKPYIIDSNNKLFELIKYRILTSDLEEIANIMDVTEGLENRIKKVILSASSLIELLEGVKSKRYTMARIRRMFMHLLINFKKSEMRSLKGTKYARILGISPEGLELLRQMKKTAKIPIVSNLNKIAKYENSVRKSLDIDGKALDLWDILAKRDELLGRDRRIIPYMKDMKASKSDDF